MITVDEIVLCVEKVSQDTSTFEMAKSIIYPLDR